MYGSKMKSEETDHLFEAILSLKDLEECYRFFDDLCTFSEIQAMTQRLQVAEMLEAGNTFSQISKEIGACAAVLKGQVQVVNGTLFVYRARVEGLVNSFELQHVT